MFSVLMSIYKNDSPDELEESYNSLLNQGSSISQFVLVCDGPVGDELNAKVLDFESKAKLQNIIFKCVRLDKNQGLGKALAIGQTYCSNDYIVRMDSDDISLENRLLELSNYIKENPDTDVIGAQIEEFSVVPGDLGNVRKVPLHHNDIFKYSKVRNPMNHVTVCIKKSALEDCGGYEDVLWHEDYYLWVKMLQKGFKFANLSNTHVAVRVKGIGGRRTGSKYFKAELNFLNYQFSKHHFSFYDRAKYLLPRVFFRFMPSSLTGFMYRMLRA